MNTVITPEIEAYIIMHRFSESRNDMAISCGISTAAVSYYMRKHNLIIPKKISRKFTASKLKRK